MKHTLCRFILAVLTAAPAALGQHSGLAPAAERDWRADWRRERNRLVDADPSLTRDPTSILIQFRPHADDADIELLLMLARAETIETFPILPGLHHVMIHDQLDEALATVALLGDALGTVEYAEPDRISSALATPDDPSMEQLWGLHNTGQLIAGSDPGTANADIDAPRAWDTFKGNPEFTIAIFDTGLRRTHEDLAANIWTNPGEVPDGIDNDGNGRIDDLWGWDFYNNDNDPSDDHNHGTHVAGTIGARGNNGRGIAGVNWYCRLASLKISSASASVSDSAVIQALSYCIQKDIRISNHSWGGRGYSQSLYNACNAARAAGHLIIASAGNNSTDNDVIPFYPASFNLDNIISVAAIDNDNAKASFSNWGAVSVDIAAPGVMVLSGTRYHDAAYAYFHGTSMAAPHVTGVAALVWGRSPALTYLQVREALLSSAKPIPSMAGRCVTGGCVNARNALHIRPAPGDGPR
ncbi:MAG: S8 family serine peptidase [Phycisphaerales bacterium]|nr:S8 family serine peptidase [Phycisphaerales bacterium]